LFTPQALAYADGIPGAQRVTIAQASHLAPMEQPAALAQALLNWMNLPESGAGEQSMP
jgi:pimeloyl-ACP methyl ester carboxylesterase